MAVPILRLNVDDNPRIIVRPDQNPVQVTGNSYYIFVGVSPTIVTDVQTGNLHTISIQAPSGATGASGATGNDGASGITPTLIFTGSSVVNYTKSGTTYTINVSGATGAKGAKGDAGTTVWSGLTGQPTSNTDLVDLLSGYSLTSHTHSQYLTGFTVTCDMVTACTDSLYAVKAHTHAISGVAGLQAALDAKSGTGHTHSQYAQNSVVTGLTSSLTGHTGDTSIHTPYSAITQAISAATSGLTSSWSGLTGLPSDNSDLVDLLSGYSLTSHTHTQYVTNNTFDIYTGDTYATLTGLTWAGIVLQGQVNDLETAFTGHTGDTSIHFTKASLNSTFVNVTGDTMTGILNLVNGTTVTGTGSTQYFIINGNTGTTRGLAYKTNGNYRWVIYTDTTAETGYGAGSNLVIRAYSGASTTIHTPLSITRSTGVVNLERTPTINTVSLNNIYSQTGHTHSTYATTTNFNTYTGTTAPATFAAKHPSIVSLTGTTILDSTHDGKIVECNGTFTITLPNSMPTGYRVDIVNVGSGTITLAASTTLQSDGTKLETQYTGASAYHRGSNVWIAVGKLTT